MAKQNKPAEKYAKPHTMSGKPVKASETMGVGLPDEVKTTGVKQRGSGAAVKGFTSRGPLA